MSFWELLKIEFKKVKHGKIVPLIFVAPLLVVVSGVVNLQSYFTPEYTNAWAAMFIQSALVYAYYLLPLSMIVVCVMIAGRETQNNGILKMLALPVSRYTLSAAKFCVLLFYLFMEMIVFLICNSRVYCNEYGRNYRSPADYVSAEMVCRIISYHVTKRCGNVGYHGII